jgi:recombination protein RecA
MAKKDHKSAVKVADDCLVAANNAVAALEKRFGQGTIRRLGDRVGVKIDCIPTGIYQVDNYVIQAGGVPRARMTEIYGPESSGKTTLTLHTIAEAQAMGELAAFVDAEHALDPTYAAALGVDMDNLFVSQPDYGEQALEIVEELVRSGAFGIVVVDSVAALVPRAELDGDMGDAGMGLHARLMSQAMRKLTGAVNKSNTALIFINQIRDKIGVMFGNPETTTGGKALKFYASLRLEVRRTASNKIGEEVVSNETRVKAVKNKVGKPYRETSVPIEYGSLLEAGISNGAIDKAGSWLSFQGDRLGQGADQAASAIEENVDLYNAVYSAILARDQQGVSA